MTSIPDETIAAGGIIHRPCNRPLVLSPSGIECSGCPEVLLQRGAFFSVPDEWFRQHFALGGPLPLGEVLVWIPDPVTGMRHASLVPVDKAAGLERVKV